MDFRPLTAYAPGQVTKRAVRIGPDRETSLTRSESEDLPAWESHSWRVNLGALCESPDSPNHRRHPGRLVSLGGLCRGVNQRECDSLGDMRDFTTPSSPNQCGRSYR